MAMEEEVGTKWINYRILMYIVIVIFLCIHWALQNIWDQP